jgi:hypothetical protein
MVWERLGSASVSGTTPATSWKELDRVTLTSSGADLDTGVFTAKDNIMILAHLLPDSTTANDLTFNGSTGNEYSYRFSNNDGADSTSHSQSKIDCRYNSDQNTFLVSQWSNVSGKEKIGQIDTVHDEGGANSGSVPDRREMVAKWTGTNQINRVKFDKSTFNNFASGSELIVLGFDNDEANTGTNFWQELASAEMTSNVSNGIFLDTGTFTTKKYLMVEWYLKTNGDPQTHFNGDQNSNYAWSYVDDNSGSSAAGGNPSSSAGWHYGGNEMTGRAFIINVANKQKFYMAHTSYFGSSGANNVSVRREIAGKWTNASDQLNRIYFRKNSITGYPPSWIKVYGAD